MSDSGPQLLRPIPRRPFNLNVTNATLSEEDESNCPRDSSTQRLWSSGLASLAEANRSLSRPHSFSNLTSSTLMGIYSDDRDEPDTPWGTGARTPIKRPSIDQKTYNLLHDRSHLQPRRSSFKTTEAPVSWVSSTAAATFSLILRASLLFSLGVGYGVVVSRFHSEHQLSSSLAEGAAGNIIKPGYSWIFMAFWGVSGVVLGALLPWFDKYWEDFTGGANTDEAVSDSEGVSGEEIEAGTDWALALRAVGAFVGIVYAIRKLPWASTLQLSATLALVNPLLWWLIDRSVSGLILSAAVGVSGSILLLGVGPDMVPAPSTFPTFNGSFDAEPELLTLGGLASQATIETGVWISSVLFCSCVCFGNIGRRLAWTKSGVARGRWGDVR